jgi:hypothetical protein
MAQGPAVAIVSYPRWLKLCITWTAIVHDLAIVLAGMFAIDETPRTILNALPDGPRLVWALMLIVGGLISLVGAAWGVLRIETTGCVLVVGAKLVWVVAALAPSQDVIGTEVLAAVLVAGASGTLWRVWGLYVGQYLRIRG